MDINVDDDARMEVKDLRRHLDRCITSKDDEERTPVYAVVVIMGSTEHGACDPLEKVLKIRDEYEKKGLSFVIHCDAAWGGYFASMLPPVPKEKLGEHWEKLKKELPYVPTRALNPHTEAQLRALKGADSITIDPHK